MEQGDFQLTPLEREARTGIPTCEASRHLGRKDQTLRVWAMNDSGPLRPVRLNRRLLWPVADIKRLLGVTK